MSYLGGMIIDNRTVDTTVTIGIPTILNQGDLDNRGSSWSDPQPFVIEPLSGEKKITYTLDTGIIYNANEDYIQMPVTLSKGDGTTSNGTISIYTTGGKTNPDSVVFEMIIGNEKASQTINVNELESALSHNMGIGGINIVFSDAQNTMSVQQSSGTADFIIDSAIKVGIALTSA